MLPVTLRPMLVAQALAALENKNVAMLSLAPTVIPEPLAALAVPAVLANCMVLASVMILATFMILPVTLKLPPTVTLPVAVKSLTVIVPEMLAYWIYKVDQRRSALPKLRMLPVLGTMFTLAWTTPTPLGANTKLPLVLVVKMVLLAICMLLSTGPAAKT